MELTRKILTLALLLFGLCFLSGCGGQKEASVQGTVTLDDVAIGPGLITFHPVDGGVMAYSQFDTSGKYSLKSGATKGLDTGQYLVTVAVYGADSNAEQVGGRQKSKLELSNAPEIYAAPESTPIKVEVKSGRNSIPLQLKSSE